MSANDAPTSTALSSGRSDLPGSDEQSDLVERIRRGDPAAEEEFVRSFQRAVVVLLRARTGNVEASRDLAQEALFAALVAVRAGRVREADKLGAFVCNTARNLALKFLRTQRRRPVSIDVVPEPAAPSLQARVEEDERVRLVGEALTSLEDGERAVLELTWLEGCTPRAIAARLSLTSDIVRARKSRALKKVTDYVRRHIHGAQGRRATE